MGISHLSIRAAPAVAISLLFMGSASIAGTYLCSDAAGNDVYTDHQRPGCREITPTPPNDIEAKASAKAPKAPKKRSEPTLIPYPYSLTPFGERKGGARADRDHKQATYSEQDLLRAVASGDKGKTELVLRAGISANAKDEQGQSALTMAAALPSTDIARLLLTHGADVNSRSDNGASPLMAGHHGGHERTCPIVASRIDVRAVGQ